MTCNLLGFLDPPTSSVNPAILIADEGDNIQFNCSAGGILTTQRWTRNGVVLTNTQQLVLASVTSSNAGSYVCEVSGQYGGVARSTAMLHVNCK